MLAQAARSQRTQMAAVGPAVRPGDTRRRPNALSEVLAEVDARKVRLRRWAAPTTSVDARATYSFMKCSMQ